MEALNYVKTIQKEHEFIGGGLGSALACDVGKKVYWMGKSKCHYQMESTEQLEKRIGKKYNISTRTFV